ncbi:MAG: branched-chain amino acid ABC transporter permease [Desulfomonilaceae bacterium]
MSENSKEATMQADESKRKQLIWVVGLCGLAALALPMVELPFGSYVMSVLTFAFIYALLGQSWNLLGGMAKQFSLGHAAFFGLGAFATALFCNLGLPALASLGLSGLLVAGFSLPIGLICFSTRGPYFTIITLAIAEILRIVFLWRPELSGSEGIIVPNNIFSSKVGIYYLTLLAAAASIGVAYWLARSNQGLALMAIGDDEEASAEIGIKVRNTKSSTLLISAGMGAVAGGAYGLFTQYLSPNDVFSINYSLDAIFVSIIGGMGHPFGPLVGALLFSILEETLNPLVPNAHLLVLGAILIAIMFLLPKGLVTLVTRSEHQAHVVGIKIERRQVADAP